MPDTLTKPTIITDKGDDSPADRASLQAYEDAHAHLLDELRWLNLLLAAQVQRMRGVNFLDNAIDLTNYFISDESIDAMFADGMGQAEDASQAENGFAHFSNRAIELRAQIDKRVGATLAANRLLPLVALFNYFQLSQFEVQALLICLAPQIDARYAKFYAYVQNNATKELASIDLILDLLCHSSEERLERLPTFGPAAPLRHLGLIEALESRGTMSTPQRLLQADSRLLGFVLDENTADERLQPYVRFSSPLPWSEVIIDDTVQQRLRKLFRLSMDSPDREEQSPTLYLHGRANVGKKTIARALCSELGMELAVADLRILVRAKNDFPNTVRLVLREGWLKPSVIYFDHLDVLEGLEAERPELAKSLTHEIRRFGWITILAGEKPLPSQLLGLPGICAVEIPSPGFAMQKRLWTTHLNGTGDRLEAAQLDHLANQFTLTGGQIARSMHRAKQSVFAKDPDKATLTFDDLLESSRKQSQPKLSTLARKVEPLFQWHDLVLPDDKIQELLELTDHVKHRHKVMGEWGFKGKLSLGRGLNALFSGASGTGKTMAAEVIANDLGLELYKIDLSSVVSKYIGETEKNLSKIFQEAEHSNAILFFDEADALFGKRSEVKDAHDRHANIEVGYLLQKMEEYEGVVILATNLSDNMDEAFTRRMRFSVDFPLPTEKYRQRIWDGIWPKETPLNRNLDLDLVARDFEFSGGNIRNIALAAAFLAAADDTAVNMSHLKHAVQREYQKMGRMIVEEEFEGFAGRKA